MKKTALITLAVILVAAAAALSPAPLAAEKASGNPAPPPKPGDTDKCPVCGMFVYKYPDWIAAVTHADGSVAYFDGAKDMFRYLTDPVKHTGRKPASRVTGAWVIEYYGLSMIRAEGAYFVLGSDTYGPMGRELIPLDSLAEAEEFMRDHKGKRILSYKEVTPEILTELK